MLVRLLRLNEGVMAATNSVSYVRREAVDEALRDAKVALLRAQQKSAAVGDAELTAVIQTAVSASEYAMRLNNDHMKGGE